MKTLSGPKPIVKLLKTSGESLEVEEEAEF